MLRRPPLGHVLATAHDMGREYRVITRARADPRAGAAHAAPVRRRERARRAVLPDGARRRDGVPRPARRPTPLGDDGRRRLAYAMMDTLAALHAVDPAAVGLGDFGRPEGFLARQVRRWGAQLDQSRSRPLPGGRRAARRGSPRPSPTAAAGPRSCTATTGSTTSSCDPEGATVRAVLDWEMATLGDPLTDLGLLLTYWDVLGRRGGRRRSVADGLGPTPASHRRELTTVRAASASTSARWTGTSRSAASSSRSSPRASTTATRSARRSARASTGSATMAAPLVAHGLAAAGGELMDFGFDARTAELHEAAQRLPRRDVYPAEPVFAEQVAAASGRTAGPARRSSTS